MGQLHAWIYKYRSNPEKEIIYWIFHLKNQIKIENARGNCVFYDSENEEWKILDTTKFDTNKISSEPLTYEQLLRLWKNVIEYTSPPFSLNEIVEKELQVWTYYNSRDDASEKESLVWIFHLKNPVEKWLAYDVLAEKDNWFEVGHRKVSVTDKTCHPVPFEVLEKEWRRMFSKPDAKTPFQIKDILEK